MEYDFGHSEETKATVTQGSVSEVRFEPPAEDYNNFGLMVAGSVVLPLGVIATGVGIGLFAGVEEGKAGAAPAASLILGGIGTALGVVFLIIGAPIISAAPEAGEPETAVTIEPLIGPTGGGLRVRF